MNNNRYRIATRNSAVMLCAAAFLAGHASVSLASDSELEDSLLSCSDIENDAKRLTCVDELIRSIAKTSSINDSSGNELGQKYLQRPKESANQTSASYSLVSAYKDRKKRWTFEFDNGEVWQQTEPRHLPTLEEFPVRVKISEGVFGSHDLRAENFSKPVKVKRLN